MYIIHRPFHSPPSCPPTNSRCNRVQQYQSPSTIMPIPRNPHLYSRNRVASDQNLRKHHLFVFQEKSHQLTVTYSGLFANPISSPDAAPTSSPPSLPSVDSPFTSDLSSQTFPSESGATIKCFIISFIWLPEKSKWEHCQLDF